MVVWEMIVSRRCWRELVGLDVIALLSGCGRPPERGPHRVTDPANPDVAVRVHGQDRGPGGRLGLEREELR